MVGIEGTSGSVTGTTHRVEVTEQNELVTRSKFDNSITDSFDRLKVATPFALSDNIFKYDTNPLRWEILATGSSEAIHLPNESAVNLKCGSAAGDKITFTQDSYNRYQAGRGINIEMTCVIGSKMDGVIRRWGYFDNDDGVFFELSGTAFGVVQRSSVTGTPVNNRIEQVDFHDDIVNGSGISQFNLDVTKNNIYNMEFQWLSAGRVSYGVESNNHDIGKVVIHDIENVNSLTTPFMKTATLPLRYEQEVVDDGTEGAEFKAICSTVLIEGGEEPPQDIFGAVQPAEQSIGTTEEHILSIRPSGTFKGIVNRMIVVPRSISVASETKQAAFRVLIDTTTNATFSQVDSDSGVEIATGSATFTGGIPIMAFSVGKDNSKFFDISNLGRLNGVHLHTNSSGTDSDVLTIVGRSSAATANIIAGLTWGEIR